jgi:nicotinamide-nucleotide amidase
MKLEVVTIGTELVLGLTPDTNAADLGRALAAAGAEIVRHVSVPDRPAAIRAAIADALERTGFVIATGGLGPTRDDMTKVEVAALFGKTLQVDQSVLRSLEARFRRLGRPMPAINRTQAEVPEGATVLPNPRGTAPGLWLEDDRGRVAILLPGVPSEMRGLLVEEVLPRIAQRVGSRRVVLSRTLRTTGVPESALAERIGLVEEDIAPLTLAYIPSIDGVDLRLTAWSLPPDEAERRLTEAAAGLRARLEEHYYGQDGTDLAAVVLDLLRGERLAVGESCTGGLVAARITAVPGASEVFVGGVVAYANGVKTDLLDVPASTIEAHGAVSEEAVRAMAEGVQRRFDAGATIAVTGIAGPGGGTPEKPVGTVWLAARRGSETRAVKRVFPGDRGEVRARAAQAALDLLRRLCGEQGAR